MEWPCTACTSKVPTAFESVGAGGECDIIGRPRRGLLPAPVSWKSSLVSRRFMCGMLCLVDGMAVTISKKQGATNRIQTPALPIYIH